MKQQSETGNEGQQREPERPIVYPPFYGIMTEIATLRLEQRTIGIRLSQLENKISQLKKLDKRG